jgi:hypothetical protein
MSSGSCLTSKLYDKIIKMRSNSHETPRKYIILIYMYDTNFEERLYRRENLL